MINALIRQLNVQNGIQERKQVLLLKVRGGFSDIINGIKDSKSFTKSTSLKNLREKAEKLNADILAI